MRLDTDIRSFEKQFEECATDERIWQVNRCTGDCSSDSTRSLETGAPFVSALVLQPRAPQVVFVSSVPKQFNTTPKILKCRDVLMSTSLHTAEARSPAHLIHTSKYCLLTRFDACSPPSSSTGGGVDSRGAESWGGRRAGGRSLAPAPHSRAERAPENCVQCEYKVNV